MVEKVLHTVLYLRRTEMDFKKKKKKDTIGCLFPFGLSGLYPTLMGRVGNGLLSQ